MVILIGPPSQTSPRFALAGRGSAGSGEIFLYHPLKAEHLAPPLNSVQALLSK